ncbi:hypothetical protein PMAYCL1PPCAC_10949, partial [Pristionchus mayeri]
ALVVTAGHAATCSQCTFAAGSAAVKSDCTTLADHRLSCGGGSIGSGAESLSSIVCLESEWYGTTCDGKASLLGASISVSCPLTCASTCASEPTSSGLAATSTCMDGKEMRACANGDLSIEANSETFDLSKAVCLNGEKWLGFSCDGKAKLFPGSLKARFVCKHYTSDVAQCTAAAACLGLVCAEPTKLSTTEIACPPTHPTVLLMEAEPKFYSTEDMICSNGIWMGSY